MDEAAGSLTVEADAEAKPKRRRKIKEPEIMAFTIHRARLEKGTFHQDLAIAHALLDAHGHPVFDADGFGDATVEAVKAFQEAQGLKTDGVIGKNTWRALERAE